MRKTYEDIKKNASKLTNRINTSKYFVGLGIIEQPVSIILLLTTICQVRQCQLFNPKISTGNVYYRRVNAKLCVAG